MTEQVEVDAERMIYLSGVADERKRILDILKTDGKVEMTEAAGSISMSWKPRPSGEFDSATASLYVEKLVTKLEMLIKKVPVK